MQTKIFHLHALSALHVGTGQGVGVVDLPIARAKATNLPLVPGSALKGVLRDEAAQQWKLDGQQIKSLFGPDNTVEDSHAGALALGDAHLLLLPIRSFAGTVAYATCPFILRRYARDHNAEIPVVGLVKSETAAVTNNSMLYVDKAETKLALEDLDLSANTVESVDQWADYIAAQLYPDGVSQAEDWRKQMTQRFVILPDDIFSFLADTATEVRMRIRLDRQTRMVQNGALWSEENLPAEAVLWGVMGIGAARDKSGASEEEMAKLVRNQELALQIGGKHTVGRGLCRLLIGPQGDKK
ncbi:MAG: type III-B CRISPR module RAMP protein Cmr4 [Vitreoscilla sp.]|jgi:CRISPR-associated protein Cmr4|nr:type III-B CRISPR module RAMP protein Cmr4 [Vitreoscilla sp.]